MSEQRTFKQISTQHDKHLVPTVLVKLDDGTIRTGLYEGSESDGVSRVSIIDGNTEIIGHLAEKDLSDQHQYRLAEALGKDGPLNKNFGETALHGEVEQVGAPTDAKLLSDRIDTLLDGLSEKDKNQLYTYYVCHENVLQAITDTNEHSRASYEQGAREAEAQMSEKARAVIEDYMSLMDQLKWVRNLTR
jgi:hypothetical protein